MWILDGRAIWIDQDGLVKNVINDVTLRDTSNILAGMNAAFFSIEFDDFQKDAVALHAKGIWGSCITFLVMFMVRFLCMEKINISICEVYMDIILS